MYNGYWTLNYYNHPLWKIEDGKVEHFYKGKWKEASFHLNSYVQGIELGVLIKFEE